jgi:hypothetical protein
MKSATHSSFNDVSGGEKTVDGSLFNAFCERSLRKGNAKIVKKAKV